ncbi:hypothetical protein C8F01DRAFT_1082672 [Mycena amicta]|nr:hypothetical protein C8F01DRAFT_1082672 [Mycena amicta]
MDSYYIRDPSSPEREDPFASNPDIIYSPPPSFLWTADAVPCSLGLFDTLSTTPPTEPSESAKKLGGPLRFSCGENGVGTVDPMKACAFEPYADTAATAMDVDTWSRQPYSFGVEIAADSPADDAESDCDSEMDDEDDELDSSASEYEETSKRKAVASKPQKPRVARTTAAVVPAPKAQRKAATGPVRQSLPAKGRAARAQASPLHRPKPSPATSPDDDDIVDRVPHLAVAAAKANGARLPANANEIQENLHYLLLLGCVIVHVDGKPQLACKINENCSQFGCAKRPPDMERHIVTHFRSELEQRCTGCPLTFSRPDARKRHWDAMKDCRQASEERQNSVLQFNALREVVDLRIADQEKNRKSNKKLEAMWDNFLRNGVTGSA